MTTSHCSHVENAGTPYDAPKNLPQVYNELRRIAAGKIKREKSGQTLSATDLVHEAYLRLVDSTARQSWENRAHFFAAAAEAMRRIMIERARRKARVRHGGNAKRVELLTGHAVVDASSQRMLALNEALDRFEEVDATKAKFVKLRYFAGLSIVEAAELVGISRTTAHRYWDYARAWLHHEITAHQ